MTRQEILASKWVKQPCPSSSVSPNTTSQNGAEKSQISSIQQLHNPDIKDFNLSDQQAQQSTVLSVDQKPFKAGSSQQIQHQEQSLLLDYLLIKDTLELSGYDTDESDLIGRKKSSFFTQSRLEQIHEKKRRIQQILHIKSKQRSSLKSYTQPKKVLSLQSEGQERT